ncbi:4Fe-4S binding protein [Crassaminicella profunda]|uniref:4Fe-4S binding protein n=1 Tax=Crassaminicella profunda TaxID=1286698 RepID=UPI001CA6A8DE|nr:4Fe-4S binding protein [Crassaminicella profunda]QZY54196.1 4Fe-4S binding protein [Crassaminicella profunda]
MKSYKINKNKCISCQHCVNVCPVGAISGEIKEGFTIDQAKCIKCGKCKEVCRFNAIIENM